MTGYGRQLLDEDASFLVDQLLWDRPGPSGRAASHLRGERVSKHLVIHLLHDVGLAAWTGGSSMGAVGLNGAVAALEDPRERALPRPAGSAGRQ